MFTSYKDYLLLQAAYRISDMRHAIAEAGITAVKEQFVAWGSSSEDIKCYSQLLLYHDKAIPGAPAAFMFRDWDKPKKKVHVFILLTVIHQLCYRACFSTSSLHMLWPFISPHF